MLRITGRHPLVRRLENRPLLHQQRRVAQMFPQQSRNTIRHQTRTIHPSRRPAPQMIFQKVVNTAVLCVFILIPNRDHPLRDPQILQIPPSLARDELVSSFAPRVPCA